jgi:hypothetical protein
LIKARSLDPSTPALRRRPGMAAKFAPSLDKGPLPLKPIRRGVGGMSSGLEQQPV